MVKGKKRTRKPIVIRFENQDTELITVECQRLDLNQMSNLHLGDGASTDDVIRFTNMIASEFKVDGEVYPIGELGIDEMSTLIEDYSSNFTSVKKS